MLLIGNGSVITHDSARPFISNGCLCIDDDLILEIGDTSILRQKYPLASFIDAQGQIIMPGLINTHHHIYSAFARGANLGGPAPKNFLDILQHLWWKLDHLLTLEDVRYSAYWTYIDCIKNGVTTVFDHHASYGATTGSLFTLSDVASELKLRTSLCYEVSDRHGITAAKEAIKENLNFFEASKKIPTQVGMMGLHASFTLSDETLNFCAKHMPTDCGYHIHVAEGIGDVQDSLHKYNKPVVTRLYDQGILGPQTIAGHCIHITKEEQALLKATDTMVVHNPESNMGNAVGTTPVLDLFNEGITIGLGTDGYTSDLFESLKVANILQKHHTANPSVAWTEIPTMLFNHNRTITKRLFGVETGILKEGCAADVIVVDYIPHTPLTEHNYTSHILFGFSGRQVTTTISGGTPLMVNRELLIADEAALMAKSRELANKLWQRA